MGAAVGGAVGVGLAVVTGAGGGAIVGGAVAGACVVGATPKQAIAAIRRDTGYAIRFIGPHAALAYDWLHDAPGDVHRG